MEHCVFLFLAYTVGRNGNYIVLRPSVRCLSHFPGSAHYQRNRWSDRKLGGWPHYGNLKARLTIGRNPLGYIRLWPLLGQEFLKLPFNSFKNWWLHSLYALLRGIFGNTWLIPSSDLSLSDLIPSVEVDLLMPISCVDFANCMRNITNNCCLTHILVRYKPIGMQKR